MIDQLQMMKNQNSQLLMNQLINDMLMDQSQLQRLKLNNNRSGGYGYGYATWQPRNTDPNPHGHVPSSSNNNINRMMHKANNKMYQQNNRLKLNPRRHFYKKKLNQGSKSAPLAPRNTTSFLIRSKKSGGITSVVSPSPVTPAVLPTPVFSPSSEVLVDTAKEEWGVDGYGSMKGLIRVKCSGNDDDNDEDEEGVLSESDVEEHVEVERRLDHDLSRFGMVYPNYGVVDRNSCVLVNRVDDQDTHIVQLEEENLKLKKRLLLMESEFGNSRTRLQSLETKGRGLKEEVVENGIGIEERNELLEENRVDNRESNDGEKNVDVRMEDGIRITE